MEGEVFRVFSFVSVLGIKASNTLEKTDASSGRHTQTFFPIDDVEIRAFPIS